VKKEEMAELINEFLGVDVDWKKMPKTELEKLYKFLNNPRDIISRLIDTMGTEEFLKCLKEVYALKVVESKPVRNFLKSMLFGSD